MYIVHLRNGRTITENEMDWKQIKEETNNLQDITSLQLKRGNQYFTLSVDGKNADIIQLHRAVTGVGPLKQGLVERVIGCVVGDETKYAIKLEVDEATGNVKLTIEERKAGEKKWRKV